MASQSNPSDPLDESAASSLTVIPVLSVSDPVGPHSALSDKIFWGAYPDVLFAVLIGSRVEGGAHEHSDWDIAVLWRSGEVLERVGKHEVLRRALARLLDLEEARVDLIDLANSGLAMRAVVAEEGRLLFANDELAWIKYLIRTWRELEDYYWEQSHVA